MTKIQANSLNLNNTDISKAVGAQSNSALNTALDTTHKMDTKTSNPIPSITQPITMLSASFFLQIAEKQQAITVDTTDYSKLPMARGVSFHSGRVREGDAFFALPGEQGHGIKFAEMALAAGAAFIVSDVPHEQGIVVEDPAALLLAVGKEARQQLQGPVVAVTGSAGKTSSKAMLAAALDSGMSPGNFNTPLALARVLVDTWLAGEITPEHKLVLELGIDHPGEMDVLLDLVQPTHGLITVISESHLSELGSVEIVAQEKTKLIAAAEQTLVSAAVVERLTEEQRKRVIVYGLDSDLDISATKSVVGCLGVSESVLELANVTGSKGQQLTVLEQAITLPYLGDIMATNAIGAMAMADLMGLNLEAAAQRLEQVELEPHRLQLRSGKAHNFIIVDDCYNSNPVSVSAALEVMKTLAKPHHLILGDMLELGEQSEELHRKVGKLSQDFDSVICVGKEAAYIAKENSQAKYFDNFESAQSYIEKQNFEGTVLLKASRGMRFERLLDSLEESKPAQSVVEGQA